MSVTLRRGRASPPAAADRAMRLHAPPCGPARSEGCPHCTHILRAATGGIRSAIWVVSLTEEV